MVLKAPSFNANTTANNMQSQINSQSAALISQALASAKNYLQGVKTLGGGTPGVPMKTMEGQQNDVSIANAKRTLALNELQKYTDLSGKVPSIDILKTLNVDNTFSPLAGQNTIETTLNNQKLALSSAGGSNSGGGNSGGNEGGLTASERKKMMDDYKAFLESRKRPNDAMAEIDRSAMALKANGLTDGDILALKMYVNNWQQLYDEGKRQFGLNYKPPVKVPEAKKK